MKLDDNLQALAPHVQASWREQFITELNLQGASAAAISDALGEVETHCRESARSAEQAFGPAAHYAKALELPDESRWTPVQLVATWTKILLLVAGVWAIFLAAPPLARGQRAQISAELLATAGATVVMMVIVFSLGDRALRLVVEHPVWSTLGFMAAVAVVPLVGLPFDDATLATVAAGPTVAIGIIAVLISSIWTVLAIRADTGRLKHPSAATAIGSRCPTLTTTSQSPNQGLHPPGPAGRGGRSTSSPPPAPPS